MGGQYPIMNTTGMRLARPVNRELDLWRRRRRRERFRWLDDDATDDTSALGRLAAGWVGKPTGELHDLVSHQVAAPPAIEEVFAS
jgi:hypothetical protein